MKKIILLLFASIGLMQFSQAQSTWSELCTTNSHINANGPIYGLDSDPYGNVYAAGAFKMSSGFAEVMKFNGNSWSQLGNLNANMTGIRHLLVKDTNDIYACGWFTNSTGHTYVAHWDGNSWKEVGGNSTSPLNGNGPIWDLDFDNQGNLYACGWFTNGSGHNYVAKWDGTNWTEVGTGVNSLNANNTIWDLEIDNNNNIYVSGYFTDINGNRYAAMWNGTTWVSLGGTSNPLNANNIITAAYLDKTTNEYYVGGRFTNSNGNQYVAKWNGTTWSQVGNMAFNGDFTSLMKDPKGNLLATGAHVNTSGYTSVYKWDGANWTEINGTTGPLNGSAATYWANLRLGILYTCGYFTDMNAKYYVAKTDYVTSTGLTAPPIFNSIQITPNPSSETINFECPESLIGGDYFIYNQTGELAMKGTLETSKIQLKVTQLASGTYLNIYKKGTLEYSSKWVKSE